ncbi:MULTISPECIES: ABC transporter permease [unclassified Streptomyces]|uniref:ABC transporter permease n=1 Tax=unclassified Streptomyces TaxID=2593676 RepID=UPI002E36DB0F|nr:MULTISPECIES: ABC transporter permease [unclassified Streptomyces]WUC64607.1 ABC transporter permease [Streptomyces sp. NBC_00539]
MTVAFPAVLNSEWTKIRTVSSTVWTLAIAVIATVGFGAGFCALISSAFDSMPEIERATFDPTLMSFSGMQFGQLAMIVFGVLVVSTEYSTGMIRSSLAAVPGRGGFLLGKLTVATVLALLVGLLTSFTAFFVGQAILGEHGIGIGQEHVLRAVIGAGVYMALLALFSMGVATMLRSSVASISILIPFFLIVSNLLSGFEATRKYGQYLPDKAGSKLMQVVPDAMGRGEAPYGPWGGLAIMLVWVAASVLGGYVVLRKRDA